MQLGLLDMLPETFTCSRCHRELPVETLRAQKARRAQRGRGVLCEECRAFIDGIGPRPDKIALPQPAGFTREEIESQDGPPPW